MVAIIRKNHPEDPEVNLRDSEAFYLKDEMEV